MSQKRIEKEEFWGLKVSFWEDSGLTARQFCIQEDLGYQSFLTWKRRILEGPRGFIELEDKKDALIELNCGDISLRVSADLSSLVFSHLILSLHQASQQC